MKRNIILITATVLLTQAGCTSMNSSFSCPIKSGLSCESLDEVNAMVDASQVTVIKTSTSSKHRYSRRPLDKANLKHKKLRVWVAPFEDESGTHSAHTVDMPIKISRV